MKRLVIFLVLLFAAQHSPTATEQLKSLRQQAREASGTHDGKVLLRSFLDIQELLHSTQNSLKSVAVVYAQLGDDAHAIRTLETMAEMGIGNEAFQAPELALFAPLKDMPRYRSAAARLAHNGNPVANSRQVFSLEDPGIVAEDIDYDPSGRSFLITSVLEKKILRVDLRGKAADFAHSPDNWPMFALKIDTKHHFVWATEVALNDFKPAPEKDRGRSALVCFDLRSGALLRRIEGARGTALGDLLLTSNGTPIVSDGSGGGIYRLKGNQLDRIDYGDFISPQTATMHPDGKHIFVPDYLRGIAIFDIGTGKVQWLAGTDKHLLSGIDGLYFDHGRLIATQNGTSPERVVRFKLDAALARVESDQIIERATPTLGDPTHGVIVGNKFYYVANSGWSALDDQGGLLEGARMTPAHIVSFELR